MNKPLNLLSERVVALMSALAFAVTALFPFVAWAEPPSAVNIGRMGNKPGARTGDPLDTNDTGGDDTNDNAQGTNSYDPARDDTWRRILPSSRVVFVPQYNGTTLLFKVIFISDTGRIVEDSDAK